MTTPTFTPPPAAPSRSDAPGVFVARANAFVAWLVTFVTEMAAAVVWFVLTAAQVAADSASSIAAATAAAISATAAIGGTGYVGTSPANLTVSAGAKAVTGLVGKSFANTGMATLIYRPDRKIRMRGVISAANMGAGTMTVTVAAGDFSGAGTLADWLVVSSEFETLPAAVAADLWSQASNILAVTPKALRDANAPVALAPGSTVTPDLSLGRRFTLTASASFTLANLVNCAPGDVIEILITNSAGSIVLAVGSAWKRQNGLFILDPANGHTNKLIGIVETVDGANTATLITYNGQRNPS